MNAMAEKSFAPQEPTAWQKYQADLANENKLRLRENLWGRCQSMTAAQNIADAHNMADLMPIILNLAAHAGDDLCDLGLTVRNLIDRRFAAIASQQINEANHV